MKAGRQACAGPSPQLCLGFSGSRSPGMVGPSPLTASLASIPIMVRIPQDNCLVIIDIESLIWAKYQVRLFKTQHRNG